jgi:hypothetical protein
MTGPDGLSGVPTVPVLKTGLLTGPPGVPTVTVVAGPGRPLTGAPGVPTVTVVAKTGLLTGAPGVPTDPVGKALSQTQTLITGEIGVVKLGLMKEVAVLLRIGFAAARPASTENTKAERIEVCILLRLQRLVVQVGNAKKQKVNEKEKHDASPFYIYLQSLTAV